LRLAGVRTFLTQSLAAWARLSLRQLRWYQKWPALTILIIYFIFETDKHPAMSTHIDYRKICKEVTIGQILGHYHVAHTLSPQRRDLHAIGTCPMCKKRDSFQIDPVENTWACPHCGIGNIIDLVVRMERLDGEQAIPTAAKLLSQWYFVRAVTKTVEKCPEPRISSPRRSMIAEAFRRRMHRA
jgi:hypothetical protein